MAMSSSLPPLLLPLLLLLLSLLIPTSATPGSSRPPSITSPSDISADCHLRAFALEFATRLQPPSPPSNWSLAVADGLELDVLCTGTNAHHLHLPPSPFPFLPISPRPSALLTSAQLIDSCPPTLRIFVDAIHGNDSHNGTQLFPLLSPLTGLTLLRSLRTSLPT